jgi:hypothetical protein
MWTTNHFLFSQGCPDKDGSALELRAEKTSASITRRQEKLGKRDALPFLSRCSKNHCHCYGDTES